MADVAGFRAAVRSAIEADRQNARKWTPLYDWFSSEFGTSKMQVGPKLLTEGKQLSNRIRKELAELDPQYVVLACLTDRDFDLDDVVRQLDQANLPHAKCALLLDGTEVRRIFVYENDQVVSSLAALFPSVSAESRARPVLARQDECLSGRSMNHPLSTSFNDAADLIEKYGWLQDEFGDKTTGLCEEGAVLAVECTPGDQHLARQVLITLGGGAVYNDAPGRTKAEVIKHLRSIGSITDDDLEQTFGPNWKPIRNFVRQAAKMTPEQAKELKDRGDVHDAAVDADRFAAWHAVRSARWHAVRSAAWEAVRYAVRDATRPVVYDAAVDAVRSAAWDAVRSEVREAVRYAVRDAVRYAAAALVVIDIAPDAAGILLGPWSAVMGDPRDVAV